MGISSYFGFKCPRCGSTVDIGIGSGAPTCPSCGTKMKPNASFGGAAANVYCRSCNTAYGLVNSSRCPQCGGSLTAMLS